MFQVKFSNFLLRNIYKNKIFYILCPKHARPQIILGFAIQMEKNYYKQVVAFSNAPKVVVYKYDKCERLERCFCVNFIKISTPQLCCAKGRLPSLLG